MTNSDKSYAVDDLLDIMAKLRDAIHGCAWNREQTLESLTSFTLEEVYEVIDAIDRRDDAHLRDELGDLLFQVIFYSQIASEKQQFNFNQVVDAISKKLLRRHPHVFPDGTANSFGSRSGSADSAETVSINWEAGKNRERRRQEAESGSERQLSVLNDIPRSFPAVERAGKLQKRAASIGFDWPSVTPVFDKLSEECSELQQAAAGGNKDEIAAELGDVLFTCINLARHLGVEPEASLRSTNRKFEQRFRFVEQALQEAGRYPPDDPAQKPTLEEMELYWQQAKKRPGRS